MTDQLMIVQFPHPGPEHKPAGDWMPWNRGAHARKFLCSPGRLIAGGRAESGEICFWGEWEPQSTVKRRFPPGQAGGPSVLHRPYLQALDDKGFRQNTDPLVFGSRFLYSNCRQRNHKLRELAPGSLILFGSALEGRFVLDTVIVVQSGGAPYSPTAATPVSCPDWISTVVFEPLRLSHDNDAERFRPYWGRRHDDPGGGPFSFVPCRPRDEHGSPFPRPAIELAARWITPLLRQSARATPATMDEVRRVWTSVVEQVTAAGLALAVTLEPPALKPGLAREPQGTRSKC